MAQLTRDQILARKTGKGTATLPDGSTVKIRALTRDEILTMHGDYETPGERDSYIISRGMTDPALTFDEVQDWAAVADAGDLVAISEGIAELSGLKEKAGKGRTSTSRRTRPSNSSTS